jgi:methylmalonyl-CoA mutase
LHTNSFDEAVGLPTDFSARIARNTQIIVQEESQICHVVDPLAGSYYLESLTDGIIREAEKIIDEVEEMGGMAKAIGTGMPKLRIEESAARKQAQIDQGKDVIVGVNKYQIEEDVDLQILEVPAGVRDDQIARLKKLKTTRDSEAVQQILQALTKAAASDDNLLELCIKAVRARATVGEISDALEKEFGRYVATTQCISGVYAAEYGDAEIIEAVRKRTEQFQEKEGRRPMTVESK